MVMNEKIVGILLAGGLSRRYGSPKAFAEINGRKFYERVYETLNSVCDHVVIVTRNEFVDWFPDEYHVIVDIEEFSGCGPLAGIYSAMMATDARNYIVLPCDMPLMNSTIIKNLISYHTKEVAVVVSEDYLQPLVSVWSRDVKQRVRAALEKGHFKMTDVLETTDHVRVEGNLLSTSAHVFMNVNTPEEDKEMRKWKES